jgi:hypothetical protein
MGAPKKTLGVMLGMESALVWAPSVEAAVAITKEYS